MAVRSTLVMDMPLRVSDMVADRWDKFLGKKVSSQFPSMLSSV